MELKFVSILASFCVWTKSLICKDAVNKDSTWQSFFRRLCTAKKIEDFRFPVSRPDDVSSLPDAHLSTLPSVWTTCSSSIGRQTDQHHSSRRRIFSVRTLNCIEKLLYPACICPDISAARLDAYQYSNSLRFFPSSNKGKIDQPFGRCGIPSGCASP
jgi:hypothetical protein